MIFASDLDQTMIYSEASMGVLLAEEQPLPVEWYEGRYISYVSRQTAELLQACAERMLFVPVTTRTMEQYGRLFFFRDTLPTRYAVTSNGGNVLLDGVPDEDWREQVRRQVEERSVPGAVIEQLFAEISSPDWIISQRLCDGLFYSIVVHKDKMPTAALADCRVELERLGWSLSIQGRKIYLVPQTVTKGAAVTYLKEKLGKSYVVASGDSLLDESLLLASDWSLAPKHGELYKLFPSHPSYRYTESSGIRAAEEIIAKVLGLHAERFGDASLALHKNA